jgi:hypothetical protein
MNLRMPTIGGIQLTTAALALVGIGAELMLNSPAAASSFAAGAALMIGNLYVLALGGRALFGLAQGGAAKLGLLLVPLKLFLFVAATYLLIALMRVELGSFVLGSLCQIAAILIETARAALRGPISNPEEPSVETG